MQKFFKRLNRLPLILLIINVYSSLIAMVNIDNYRDKKISNSNYTIAQFTNSTMKNIISDFEHNQLIQDAVCRANKSCLLRKMNFIEQNVPHIAIARVIYAADRGLHAYKIPYVFSSTIAHKDTDRFTPDIVQILKDITLGITPFKGSPCKYAHSERGIGIYLLQVLHNKIPENSSFVLIQVKTSLLPCADCKNFWNGNVNFSNTEGMFGGNFACDDGNPISQLDCLQKLKDSCRIRRIAVSINHSFQDEVRVFSSPPFERLIQ